MKKHLLASFIAFCSFGLSQENRDVRSPVVQVKGKQVHINFQVTYQQNLLLRICDSTGKTLFLENKYNFSGPYERVIPLNPSVKGMHELYFYSGSEKFRQNIIIE